MHVHAVDRDAVRSLIQLEAVRAQDRLIGRIGDHPAQRSPEPSNDMVIGFGALGLCVLAALIVTLLS